MYAIVGIRQARERAKQPPGGDCPTPTIWFASWRQLAGVLSDENRALLRLIKEEKPRTILELSHLSGRAASNLSRTLHNLEAHGLVKLHGSPGTRALRPEALATDFLVVLN